MNSSSSTRAAPYARAVRQAGASQGAVLLLGSSLTVMGAVMIAPILPKLAAEFVPADPRLGALVPLVATGPALAIALCAPLAGWLADRVGRKMLLLATLVYGLVGAAPAWLNDLGAILVCRFALGAAEACVMTCCTTLIGDYWRGEQRVRYVNRQVVTIGIVGTVFFVLGGAAGEHAWRYPFYLYLLPILLVPAIATVLWEPLRGGEPAEPHDGDSPPSSRQLVSTLATGYVLICVGMISSFVVPVQMPQLMIDIGQHSSTVIGAVAVSACCRRWPGPSHGHGCDTRLAAASSTSCFSRCSRRAWPCWPARIPYRPSSWRSRFTGSAAGCWFPTPSCR